MKKLIVYVLLVILMIVLGVVVMATIMKADTNKVIETTKIEGLVNEIEKNVVENKITNEITNEIANEITNKIENEETDKIENEVQEIISSDMTDKEKALEITKKDWGKDSKVYFTTDEENENSGYIVYVREEATTKAIYKYIIDVKTGKIIDKEQIVN